MTAFSTKNGVKTRFQHGILLGCFLVCTGCADGPLYQMKKLNPWIVKQWNEDKKRAEVFDDRIKQFDLLKAQIASYTPDEQARFINTLTQSSIDDTSPEIRRRVAMVLEEVPNDPRAIEGLAKLSRDGNEKVRMAVAKSLSKSDNSLSTQTLITMASSDKSQAVKLLAIESLGHHTDDEVKTFLASQLNDRSPAIQSSATVALKHHTGVDFRGDVAKWKQYMNGDDIQPEAPSLASQFLSIWR
ncbi:HEAT repeat domain-containing protein [Pirellulaceae bacterium SH449]